MQWLIPVVMGLWAIWTWAQEQERARMSERARLAALYVNPFLSACEDLQSRIYHILELDGLRTLHERYPDRAYADETLYLIARYFGWAVALQRYSPYAHAPEVIRWVEAVRDAFATTDDTLPVGPFNFFHPEQKALGKIVMNRLEGQHGMELDTISSYDFKERLTAPPLVDSAAVQQSLEALRTAPDAARLPGRQRLENAQHHLVDLLAYLEGQEGYHLFAGQRKKCTRLAAGAPRQGAQPARHMGAIVGAHAPARARCGADVTPLEHATHHRLEDTDHHRKHHEHPPSRRQGKSFPDIALEHGEVGLQHFFTGARGRKKAQHTQ